jgi:hypothetical protein
MKAAIISWPASNTIIYNNPVQLIKTMTSVNKIQGYSE